MKISHQSIQLPLLEKKGISLTVKREDVIHPVISGNKYRKLKYNLAEAKNQGAKTLLTFGGAFSSHIAATARAGKEYGFRTIGVIRGEELKDKWMENPTLQQAHDNEMLFNFVSRADYRNKSRSDFLKKLQETYGDFYVLPEGGTNALAVKGCEEILTENDKGFDVICCCVGTGGTMAGLVNSSLPYQSVLGFQVLKGDFLKDDISKFARNENWELVLDYHFGGYAKVNEVLIHFINDFKTKTGIPLDPIYTGKLFFGILDRVEKGVFKNGTRILAVHSGGLQGIKGMNLVLKKKKLPLIDV